MAVAKEHVRKFLKKRSALIVHFASVPLLSGKMLPYPESLKTVIEDTSLQLSCSVVQPGDVFGPYATPKHATGMIGLILRAMTDDSVLAVNSYDAGSLLDHAGTRHFTPMTVTWEDLESSMTERGKQTGLGAAYNEWGMKEYEIRGLFVASTDHNCFAKPGATEPLFERLEATYKRFLGLKIYTFSDQHIFEVDPSGERRLVSHELLYPP